ncbi:MAG TPA: TetR/AcrR family transcriptional regulator [Acidimicrobiales bacterium]|nr:TetR/AcrR family transcriptional regulator [Acidimicrobiales bacterium]
MTTTTHRLPPADPGDPTCPAGPPPRGPGRPRDETASRAIFDAALRQLEQLGYGRMTVESVAAEAGVSRASVYRRFRNKADLVTAAIARGHVVSSTGPDELSADPLPERDPRSALIDFLVEFDQRFAESCLEVIGGLVGAREDPTALAMHRERVVAPRRARARSLLEAAQARGELAADADLDVALQMLAGSVLFRRVSGERAARGCAGRAVDAIWTGMAPASPARGTNPD